MFGFGYSCNILILDLRDFLLPGFVLVIKVGTFNVHLHQFGKLFFFRCFFFVFFWGGEGGDFPDPSQRTCVLI